MSLSVNHLTSLKEILKSKDQTLLFLCIQDLVDNGLTLSRFSDETRKPSRQDITQFIAAWCKYVGVSADECRDWLIEYSINVLSAISSSSASKIRHSTKSNLKYIYGSDIAFDCGCENNVFKALCDPDCPVYQEMAEKYRIRIEREANKSYQIEPGTREDIIIQPPVPVKEKYIAQFEDALKVIRDCLENGFSKKEIVYHLNKQELKTRTGRKWTVGILQNELSKGQLYKKKRGEKRF